MVNQYDIYWVQLDPTVGSEINKIRPCLFISPNESNSCLQTILIAPITSTIRNFPMKMIVNIANKDGQICLDQIRGIDKWRLKSKLDTLLQNQIIDLKKLIKQYLVD